MSCQAVIFDLDGVLTDNNLFHRQAWQEVTQRLQHRDQARMQHRAGGNIQTGGTACRVKAKPEAIRPPPDGEISAPAGSWWRGDGLGNGGLGKAAPRQGNTQLFALPGRLRHGRPMLERAATAGSEMRACRCNAVRAGGDDLARRPGDAGPYRGRRL